MRRIAFSMAAILLVALSVTLVLLQTEPVIAAGDIHVPGDYATIQAAIEAASGGDRVSVAAGTYYENITLKNGVTVQGAGADLTTIDGGGSTVVTAPDGMDSTASLDGFTITNGGSYYNSAGIYAYHSSPTITNNVITGNGSGIYNQSYWTSYTSATIANNVITGNGYYGILNSCCCSPTIADNVITDNDTGIYNVSACSSTITNNIIADNGDRGIWSYSGGNPTISNNTITGNGYVGICNQSISSVTITNNIITDNGSYGIDCSMIYGSATIDYNNVRGHTVDYYCCSSGPHDISQDPRFVNSGAGDYHLESLSPCIDAGTNSAPALPSTDFEGDPRILDGNGDSTATVDMGADEYVANNPPLADAGADQTVEQTSYAGAEVTLDGSGSSDADGDDLIYNWTWGGGSATGTGPTVVFPLGTTTVTLTVNDGTVDSACDTVDITVVDTTPPGISVSVTPCVLWSPNHKMVEILANVIAIDICDPEPTVVLTSIVSNEPDDAVGNGDGKTVNDIQGADVDTGDFEFLLRAERDGTGDGRVYTVTYTVTDASGNSAIGVATVVVPHSK